MSQTQIIIRYFILINLITFIIRGIDKYKSQSHKRRIKEKTLLIWTAVGGVVGAILGMQAFHHKTIKGSFLTKFRLIVVVRIIIAVFALFAW